MNNKYEITSYVSHEVALNDSQKFNFAQSNEYNPKLNLSFSLVDNYGLPLNDRFILIDAKNMVKPIENDEIIEKKVNDIDIYVFYKCLNETTECEIDKEDIRDHYDINIKYQGFYVEPQNDIPKKFSFYLFNF